MWLLAPFQLLSRDKSHHEMWLGTKELGLPPWNSASHHLSTAPSLLSIHWQSSKEFLSFTGEEGEEGGGGLGYRAECEKRINFWNLTFFLAWQTQDSQRQFIKVFKTQHASSNKIVNLPGCVCVRERVEKTERICQRERERDLNI